MNGELEVADMEVSVTPLKVLFWHSHGGAEKNH
jgi:hypothetical protein